MHLTNASFLRHNLKINCNKSKCIIQLAKDTNTQLNVNKIQIHDINCITNHSLCSTVNKTKCTKYSGITTGNRIKMEHTLDKYENYSTCV